MQSNLGQSGLVLAFTAAVLATTALGVRAGNDTRTVILAGDQAPGTLAGAVFSGFSSPTLNSSGQVAFNASLQFGQGGVDETNNSGLWVENDGVLNMVAREGSQAPGTPTNFTNFASELPPVFNSRGDMAFRATLEETPDGKSIKGIWKKLAGGPLQLVDSRNDFAANVFSTPVLNDAGEVAYSKKTTDNNTGVTTRSIRLESGGSQRVVYSSDDPGFLGQPSLNNAGELAFSAINDGGSYIYSESGGSLRIVARNGGAAPGTPQGAVFDWFGTSASINNAGQTSFNAVLKDGEGGAMSGNQVGIWSEGGGTLRLVARQGNLAPDGTIYEALGGNYIDNEGYVAFDSSGGLWTDTYWSEREGVPHLDARKGDTVPGGNPGEVFGILLGQNINSSGRVAFRTVVTPAAGIYAEGCDGTLQSIVRLGDIIDVDDGEGVDNRSVSAVGLNVFTTTQDGRESPFNDRGQIAFSANFGSSANTGLFVSDAVAVSILEADFDEDGDVDDMDLLIWQDGFGMNGNALHGDGDADDDGDVDGNDFLTWQQQYGSEATCTSSSLLGGQTVPEPSSASLCFVLGLSFLSFFPHSRRSRL